MICPWCAETFDGAPDGALFGVVRCPRCGQGVTSPWPTDAQLDTAYAGFYRPDSGRFSGPGDRLLRRTRARLARRIDRLAPPGPVLDVGSGDGTLVTALRERGREARGLERGDPEPGELDGPYAAVVLWHSLEHLREPARTLRDATGLLAPRGVLAVAVPNYASLQARAFGERWFALDLPRHLVHLEARAIVARLRELGLTVRRVSHLRGGQVAFGWLHGLVGALAGGDLYDAIRRPEARSAALSAPRRATLIGAGALLAPAALVLAGAEVAARRGGTVYVEAVRG